MIPEDATASIRHSLTLGAGWLLAHGQIGAAVAGAHVDKVAAANDIAGVGVFLIALGWSMIQKRLAKVKIP